MPEDLRQLLADLDTALLDWLILSDAEASDSERSAVAIRVRNHGSYLQSYIAHLRERIKAARG